MFNKWNVVAAGAKLLEATLGLAGQYGVAAWDVRLQFVCCALQAAKGISAEVGCATSGG